MWGEESGFEVPYLIFVCLAIAGIVGGILAVKRPMISIILMLLSSLSGLIILLAGMGDSEDIATGAPAWAGYSIGFPIVIIAVILGVISILRSRTKITNA